MFQSDLYLFFTPPLVLNPSSVLAFVILIIGWGIIIEYLLLFVYAQLNINHFSFNPGRLLSSHIKEN